MKKQLLNRLSRRGFLKAVAVSTAGAVAAPYVITSTALGRGAIPPASERVTIGHIGVGTRGGKALLPNFLGVENAQSVAVCDPFRDRREERAKEIERAYADRKASGSFKGCAVYNDFRELLARDDIDAVVIATPDHWHVPIGIAAAQAGKDMYSEKPVGISMAHDKAIREAIHRHGRVFQYGTQNRSMAHVRFGCELVRNGRIGQIRRIAVEATDGETGGGKQVEPVPEGFDYDLWLGPAPAAPYTKDRCEGMGRFFIYDYCLGFIAGWGAHSLDVLHWGCPDAIPVEYEGTGFIPTENLFDALVHWDVRCKSANGVETTLKTGPDKTTFYGDNGWVAITRNLLDAEPKSLLRSRIGPDEIRLPVSNSQQQNFVDCVMTRETPVSPVDSAVQSDFICHLSDIAIRTGRKILWDPIKEEIVGDDAASRMMTRPMRAPWHL